MMPNRWKTLAFGLGISAAGMATCADQPNGQMHKAKKVDEPAEVAVAKWEDPQPVALPAPPKSGTPIRVKEFVMDVPDIAPAPVKPAAAPAAMAIPSFEIPDPPPSIIPVRATIPVSAPAKLEPSLIPFDPPVPDLPKPAEAKVEIPVLKSAPATEPLPERVPLPIAAPQAPAKVNLPAVPVEPKPAHLGSGLPAGESPVPPTGNLMPEFRPSEIVPVDARSVPKPEGRTVPPAAPNRPRNPNSMKLIVTLGDGNPRFEVKHIATNKTLLKAEAGAIEISKFVEAGTRDAELLQKLLASGTIRFSGPDIQGTCEELSILAGTGEVLLKGNVQMKTLTSKNWTTLQSDKVVYQIGNMPVERATSSR